MLRASSSTTRVGAGVVNTGPGKQPLSSQDIHNMLYSVDSSVEGNLSITCATADSKGSLDTIPFARADSMGSMGPLDNTAEHGGGFSFRFTSPDCMSSLDLVGNLPLPPPPAVTNGSSMAGMELLVGGATSHYRSIDAVAGLIVSGSSSGGEQRFLMGSTDSIFGGTLMLPPADEKKQPIEAIELSYNSRDWLLAGNHKDIEYTPRMFDTADAKPTAVSSNSKWCVDDYEKKLAPKPSRVSPPAAETSKKEAKKKAPKKPVAARHKPATKKSSPKKSTSRCVEPKTKIYFVPTKRDIKCGRGGGSNFHPGNIYYRAILEKAKPAYLKSVGKEKTFISQQIVDQLNRDKEGRRRFLKKDTKNGQWYEITKEAARTKASQALREENTEEARKAKRERFPNKK